MKHQYFNIDLHRNTFQYLGEFEDIMDAFDMDDDLTATGSIDFQWVLSRSAVEELLAEGCRILEDNNERD